MDIKKWIQSGEIDPKIENMDDLVLELNDIMDNAQSYEILGQNLFLAEDGKYYTVIVEAVVSEASHWFVREMLGEDNANVDDSSKKDV